MKKVRILLLVLLLPVLYGVYYCWISLPIATGYAAKVLGSAVFVSGRNEIDVLSEDLDFFPVNLVSATVDRRNKTIETNFFGLARQKSIYRSGFGVTLVNDIPEDSLRRQVFSVGSWPGAKPDSQWPAGEETNAQLPFGTDSALLARAFDKAFAPQDTPFVNHTRAIVIVYDGQLIAEKYATPFTRNTPLPGWSMTKSVTSALVGILANQGLVNLEEPAPVDEWRVSNDPRRQITLRHLLQQTSGLDFEEVYDRSSDANNMLFRKGDAASFAAEHHSENVPGSHFEYSSGNTNIISGIIRKVLGDEKYYAFPYSELFHKIGMYSAVLEPDASGTYVASSFCFATARDWARFGLLYLQDGVYNGVRILPAGWVRQTAQPSPAAKHGEYGFHWWLNAGSPSDTTDRIYPALPRDMIFADGYEGQNIFVIPSKKLVVVRLGLTRNKRWGETEFISTVIRALPSR